MEFFASLAQDATAKSLKFFSSSSKMAINPAPPSSVRAVQRAFERGVTLQSAAEANAPLAGSCLIHNRLANVVSLASLKLIGGNSADIEINNN